MGVSIGGNIALLASVPRSGRPVASMICAVTKMMRLLLMRFSALDWNSRPTIGMDRRQPG